MEEKNIKKLWYVCEVLRNFCEGHNDCDYCPLYHSNYEKCRIRDASGVNPENLYQFFPTSITEDDE